MNDTMNPSSMTDVDLVREWDGATISLTIYNGEDSDLDNLLHQGYKVLSITTVL